MLVHFRCEYCGTALSARDDWSGNHVNCTTCRHRNTVPWAEGADREAKAAAAAKAEDERVRAEFEATCLRESEDEARKIAWVNARGATRRAKRLGVGIMAVGATPTALAMLAIVTRTLLGFPLSSLGISMVFGSLAMLLGLSIWRRAEGAAEAEFHRVLPIVVDRIRQQHLEAWEAQRRSAPSPLARA